MRYTHFHFFGDVRAFRSAFRMPAYPAEAGWFIVTCDAAMAARIKADARFREKAK